MSDRAAAQEPGEVAGVEVPRSAPTAGAGVVSSLAPQIQSIFDTHCTVCHRVGGLADQLGIALKLTEDVSCDHLLDQNSVQNPALRFVVPGDSGASLLFLKVSSDTPPIGSRMPLGAPALSAADIVLIQAWIDGGALDCGGCLVDGDCADAEFCNGAEACQGGACTAGSDPCPGQTCDEGSDACAGCLVNADCDDSAFCNGAETCQAGSCVGGVDPCPGQTCDESSDDCLDCLSDANCDDGEVCTDDVCSTGVCQTTTNTASCDDGDSCTENDVCENGVCGGASITNCCALDADCDDANPCTNNACDNGLCEFTEIPDCLACDKDEDCDDGDTCTDDRCEASVCEHTNNQAACDDGDPCTTSDVCTDGACAGVTITNCCETDPECDDRDLCTDDACVENQCVHTPAEECSDEDDAQPSMDEEDDPATEPLPSDETSSDDVTSATATRSRPLCGIFGMIPLAIMLVSLTAARTRRRLQENHQ